MNPRRPRPPRSAERLLGLLLPWRYREEHLGDLEEGFGRRLSAGASANRWYWGQVLRSIPAALALRYQTRNDDPAEPGLSMEMIIQDLRYGLRALRRSPGFAIVSTLTLALAIGVNTSIFSMVSAIVFADLPMQETETVAVVRGVNPELEIDQGGMSPADYMDLVERSRAFESLSALTEGQWVLTGLDQPMRVTGLQFTAGLTERPGSYRPRWGAASSRAKIDGGQSRWRCSLTGFGTTSTAAVEMSSARRSDSMGRSTRSSE